MSELDPETARLAQEVAARLKRSIATANEATRLAKDAGELFKAGKKKEGTKLLEESERLMSDVKRLKEEDDRLLKQYKELQSRADVGEPLANYVTCRCQHCDTGIEFNAAELAEENSIISCPHCGLETKLFIPQTPLSQPSAAPTLADSELEAFVDRFTTETNFLKAIDVYDATTREKLYAIWLRNPRPSEAELAELMNGLTLDETSQVLKIEGWSKTMDFLQSLQKKKAGRMKIVSINNELELADDNIIIRRRGVAHAMAAGLTGERMIPISTLTAIQLKPGAWWSPGFILFSYAGSKPFMGGIIEATQDPDAFIFQKELNDEVSTFKAKVEKILRDSKQATPASNFPPALTDEIRKLAELKQQGILSQEEFDAAKKKLLA
jgi:hypothetical protein